ncbi:MAG: hypothetical protein ACLQO6_07985 [Desulfomonilaceae bacterium]
MLWRRSASLTRSTLISRLLESVLCVYPRLGRKEDPAPPDACPETSGLRLEAME